MRQEMLREVMVLPDVGNHFHERFLPSIHFQHLDKALLENVSLPIVSNLDAVEDLVDKVHPRVLLVHLSRLVSVHNVPHLRRVLVRFHKSCYQNVDTRAFSGRQTTRTASPMEMRVMYCGMKKMTDQQGQRVLGCPK